MAETVSNVALNSHSTDVSGGTTPSGLFIRDVPDWTKVLVRTDTPFLKLIGGLKGSAPKVPMLKAEWGWGSPDPMEGELAEALDTSEVDIDVVDGDVFQVGDLFRIDDEDFRVTAIAGNTLTVGERGFRGTTAAAHSSGAVIYKNGIAIAENAADPLSPITQGELDYNYHEIVIFNWQMSERAKVTATYESRNFSGNRFEQELKKKMNTTAPVYLERMLLEGLRNLGTSTVPSTMGGLRQSSYITTRNTVAASGPLTELAFMDTGQDLYNLVGQDKMARTVMLGSVAKRIINSWYNDTRRTSGGDTSIGVNFDTIKTDFGDFKFVINYQLDRLGRGDEIYFLNPEEIVMRPYASSTGWKTGMIATNGWFDRGFLRADVTTIWQNPDARAALTGFSVTESDYPSLA
jgi:hypothetical protein